jgi:hypothetical protein
MITKMKINNQDGATVVEFAIIVPILLLLIFGIIEFSLLLFNKHIITNSSREGARAGIVARENRFTAGDSVNVINTVNDWIANNLVTFGGTGQPKIDVGETDSSGTLIGYYYSNYGTVLPFIPVLNRETSYRDPLGVRVSYEYHFLFLSNIGLGPIGLVSQANMLME